MSVRPIVGAGIGLRRGLFAELRQAEVGAFDFLELAPENWIGVGGRFKRSFDWFAARYPLVCHGLSLSLGGPAPLDRELLRDIRNFLAVREIHCYTEHLSACSDHGQLYDLLPIPFTRAAASYAAKRILEAQDVLQQRIGIEHVSYYAAPGAEMSELEFVLEVLREADCGLLLDVNNVHVNSVNHGYDAAAFIAQLPSERIMYMHIAGHYQEAPGLLIDTHGAPVAEAVWELLDFAYRVHGPRPTLLERDFNFPGLDPLAAEVGRVRAAQARARRESAEPLCSQN